MKIAICSICNTEIFVADPDFEGQELWAHLEAKPLRLSASICDDPTPKPGTIIGGESFTVNGHYFEEHDSWEWCSRFDVYEGEMQVMVFPGDAGKWYWQLQYPYVEYDYDYGYSHSWEVAKDSRPFNTLRDAIWDAIRMVDRYLIIDGERRSYFEELMYQSERADMVFQIQRDEWECEW